ncbi:hypothetical protein L1987_42509 [Smallanthus sonchifolius]|uniref:Uncharacterized protein n=1 Tax=Smallanthus sonchifolius TaxID=185202 RepID=A0ACB9GIY7_9ASTR|nr:hypothetical protein L1987_42509 [Smallanthus sonchifolius]
MLASIESSEMPWLFMWVWKGEAAMALCSRKWGFAKDARGPIGGFVWPPRSYSCSLCRREFRSVQVLCGHMNVQWRERAKLKQNPKSLLESTNTIFFSSPDDSPSRVSSIRILSQESTTLASNSDAKSYVYDKVLVLGLVETHLYLLVNVTW